MKEYVWGQGGTFLPVVCRWFDFDNAINLYSVPRLMNLPMNQKTTLIFHVKIKCIFQTTGKVTNC